jgi:signal peptidase I
MGDNRDDSFDSRYWGFLGRDRVRGRPLFIYYSYDKNGVLPLPFFTAIRWSRILSQPH